MPGRDRFRCPEGIRNAWPRPLPVSRGLLGRFLPDPEGPFVTYEQHDPEIGVTKPTLRGQHPCL